MRRRRLLGAVGTTLAAGLAGCSDGSDAAPDPEPAASELRVRVENSDVRTHSVAFLLRTTRDSETTVEGFESGDVEPGETWTREPQTLDPGEYELDIRLPTMEMEAAPTWAGHDCSRKAIEIELRENGFQIRTDCPEE